LDEAMAGMTLHEIEQVHAALRRAMSGGCAIVAIEHVLPAIVDLASRAQVLDFGRIIASGTPHEVLRNPEVISAYMGADYDEG
jgi:ABC-type branched-subunit amino acid transport system ATPase component